MMPLSDETVKRGPDSVVADDPMANPNPHQNSRGAVNATALAKLPTRLWYQPGPPNHPPVTFSAPFHSDTTHLDNCYVPERQFVVQYRHIDI